MEFGNTHKRKKSCAQQQQPIINEIVTNNTDSSDYISTLLPVVSCVVILSIIYLLYKDLQKTKAEMYVVDQNIKSWCTNIRYNINICWYKFLIAIF